MILAGFIGECTDSTVIENSKSDQYIYEVHNNYVEIKEYIGNEVSITIPESIREIGEEVFKGCDKLTK